VSQAMIFLLLLRREPVAVAASAPRAALTG